MAEDISKGTLKSGHFLYQICLDDKKIGYIELSFDQNTAWLDFVFIDEPYRNKGYAKQAILKMQDQLYEIGMKKHALNVFAKNKTAIDLYKQLGYKITEIYKNKDGSDRNYLMVKKLDKLQSIKKND